MSGARYFGTFMKHVTNVTW